MASAPSKSVAVLSRARQARFWVPSIVTKSGMKPQRRLSPDTVVVGMKRVCFIIRGEMLSAERILSKNTVFKLWGRICSMAFLVRTITGRRVKGSSKRFPLSQRAESVTVLPSAVTVISVIGFFIVVRLLVRNRKGD